MRIPSLFVTLLLLAGAGTGTALADDHEPEAVGNLAQVMRAILFPNSNLLFDVQTGDPEKMAEKTEGDSVTSSFSGIYKGWMVVEQAAIALAESEALIMKERACENGKPAPVGQDDYQKWVKQLTEAGRKTLAAAENKDRDAVIELTNDIAVTCEDCHARYRSYEDRCRQ